MSIGRSALVMIAIGSAALAAPKGRPKKTPPKTTATTATTPMAPKETGSGSGSGSDPTTPVDTAPKPDAVPATPAPPPVETKVEADKKDDTGEVDALRQEYLTLRDELFKSRARANAVASALYSTRISIKLTYTTARYYNPAKASIRLDGASVYENASGAIAGDDGVRFDGYVAPGKHLITFRVEATGKDDDSFTSTTETQITVKAVPNKDLVVSAKAHDAGDIAYEWKRKEQGKYGLGIDVGVKTEAHLEGAKK